MGTVTAISVSGLLWGLVHVDAPCTFGPMQLAPDGRDPSRVHFRARLDGLSFERTEGARMIASEQWLANLVRWSIVTGWGASIDQVHVHGLDALVDGEWEQVHAAATVSGRTVAVLDVDQPDLDPAGAFAAVVSDPSLGHWLGLYSAGLAAHQTLGDAGLLTAVTLYATIVEAAGQIPNSLKDAERVADALRSLDHPIPPNPSRRAQHIRSAVAHAHPANPTPTVDEVEWFRATALAWITQTMTTALGA